MIAIPHNELIAVGLGADLDGIALKCAVEVVGHAKVGIDWTIATNGEMEGADTVDDDGRVGCLRTLGMVYALPPLGMKLV